MKKNLVIEIYTEELPLSCIEEYKNQLKIVSEEVFKKYNFEYDNINTYVTPVRLIVYVKNLSEYTKKVVQEIIGPSVNVAIKDNEYTQAAVGFAKKNFSELKDLYIKETEKGKFVALKKIYGGENVKNVVSKILYDIVFKLSYPKQMVWEETRFKFPRPIRNVLIIYGNDFIKTKFLSINSTNYTYGIKTFPLKKIKITAKKHMSLADSYFEILKNECIIFDEEERLEILMKKIRDVLKTTKKELKIDNDENLFKEILHIIEYPTCVLCNIPKDFLFLPKEFIIICMKTKQKFIPVYTDDGQLVDLFIGVKNGFSEFVDNIKKGYEKVLIARLNDVKYYYETDKKIDFVSRFEQLKGIIYNAKLDSLYYDKVLRIKQLAEFINEELGFHIEDNIIDLTSKVIKNDLTTQIVYEYPELIGVAGRIYFSEYCKNNNLPLEVAECCQEHYLPKSYDDNIPKNKLSLLFSLSNKISDLIDMCISENLPTGSSDPYGVKKIADGIIKISKELKLNLNLDKIIEFYLEHPVTKTSLSGEKVIWDLNYKYKVIQFLSQRFENLLLQEGYKIDEIRTVLYNFNGEVNIKLQILNVIKIFRQKDDFVKFIELYKRINNILIQAKNKKFEIEGEIKTNLFVLDEEKFLYETVIILNDEVNRLFLEQKFEWIINLFLEKKFIIDNFFDKVLVFDENKDVALNRLRILNLLLKNFNKIGAFENIQL